MKLGRVVGFLIVLLLCGEHMRPGDTCLRFGKGAVSQTYDEMEADHTPAKLAHTYANRRAFGVWLMVIGGVLGALIVLRIVLSTRAARIARAKAVAAG